MKILKLPFISGSLCVAALVMSLTVWTPVQAQSRYAYSADGAEVTDAQTGLVWRRCSAGQTWSGTNCVGGFTVLTHEGALAYAATQTGWRLPNIKELRSLVDENKTFPSLDTVAFPGTATAAYWSSTPDVQLSSSAWCVDFAQGAVRSTGRNTFGVLVRLVR
jgi:Protein of unknown function (DUF1566)